MKTLHGLGLGAVATLLFAGAWLGCGGDDSTLVPGVDAGHGSDTGGGNGDSGGGGRDTGAQADTGGGGGDSGGGGDAGDSGGGGGDAGPLDCPTYCAAVMANCTGGNQQYETNDACLRACKFLPLGTAGDPTGNTVACRIKHAGFAKTTPDPHCWHAGPFGYGACGDECGDFCQLVTSYCSADGGLTTQPPYATLAACQTACGGYVQIDSSDAGVDKDGGFYASGPGAGNTLDCREYHLGNALTNAANQKIHCSHTSSTSVVCK